MEKINSRKDLIEMLKNLKAVETVARDMYNKDKFNFKDPKILEVIKAIKIEEIKHIYLVDFLINMLEEN